MTIPDISTDLLPPEAKGLVFDLDGTVLNTMPYHWAAWKQTTIENGIELTLERLLSLAGKPSRDIMELLCDEQGLTETVDISAAVKRKQDIYVELAVETKPIDFVLNIAKVAKSRGMPIAVATGGSKRQVSTSLRACGLETFFDAVVTCDDVNNGKPHPETFHKAAELIGIDPKLCVGYEDAPLGMEAIEKAGFMKAINVTLFDEYPSIED